MASQDVKSISLEIFAILGAVLWAIQLLGQLWSNFQRKSTKGLQTSMMLIWAGTGNVLALHNHLSHQPIALVVQAELLFCLSLLTWIQTLRYTRLWPVTWCAGTLIVFSALSGGVQAAFIVGIQALEPSSKARQAIRIIMATLSTLGLSVGVLQHYLGIFRNKSVEGISWSYVSIDALGDVFSVLAVVQLRPFHPATLTIYASELALWMGIMLLGLGLNLPSLIRRDLVRRLGADIEVEIISGSASDLPARLSTSPDQRPLFQGGSIFSTAQSPLSSHPELSTYELRQRVLARPQNSLETL